MKCKFLLFFCVWVCGSFPSISQDQNATSAPALSSQAFGPLGEPTGRYVRPQYVYWENASRANSQNFYGAVVGYEFEKQGRLDLLEFEINHGLVGGAWSNSDGYYGDYDHRTTQFLISYKIGYELNDRVLAYGGLSLGPSLYRHTYTYNGPSTGSNDQWDWVFSVGPTLGMQYKIKEDLSFDVGYRYFMSWGGEWYGRSFQHADVHMLTLGFNYSF